MGKICGNRPPRLHIRVNLTWYILVDGTAQSLLSKFTAYQSLESTCIGLIGSNNFFNLQQQIVCIIVRHVRLTTNIDYPQIRKFEQSANWKNNYKEYLMPPKMPKYAQNMQYAHFAKICEKCGKVPNVRKSHIRVFLKRLFCLLLICRSRTSGYYYYNVTIYYYYATDANADNRWYVVLFTCFSYLSPPYMLKNPDNSV